MPWVPGDAERQAAIALATAAAREAERDAVAPRLDFYEGIAKRDAEDLADSFSGEPRIDDPVHGQVEGQEAFRAYVDAVRREVADYERVALTMTPERTVEEALVTPTDGSAQEAVAIVSEFAGDGRIDAIRVYRGGDKANRKA